MQKGDCHAFYFTFVAGSADSNYSSDRYFQPFLTTGFREAEIFTRPQGADERDAQEHDLPVVQ